MHYKYDHIMTKVTAMIQAGATEEQFSEFFKNSKNNQAKDTEEKKPQEKTFYEGSEVKK